MHICVICTDMCTCVCMCVLVCRGHCQVAVASHPTFFETCSFTKPRTYQLGWSSCLASAQGSSCLCLLSAGMTGMLPHPTFYVGFFMWFFMSFYVLFFMWVSSVPQTYVTNALLISHLPRPGSHFYTTALQSHNKKSRSVI